MNALARRTPNLSIVVPCYNEAANLRTLVERTKNTLDRFAISGEILLIDDGSSDGTREGIQELEREHPEVRGLYHEQNRGIVGGWRTGANATRSPHVLITDADLQYAPEDIPRLYEILLRGEGDIVQGWRVAHNFKGSYRYLLSISFSFLLNRLFGTRLRDIKSGFLCTRTDVFRDVLKTRYRYRYFQHLIVVNAVSKGYRVRQEPVLFWARNAGESFIRSPLVFGLSSLRDLPRAFWEFRVLNHRRGGS